MSRLAPLGRRLPAVLMARRNLSRHRLRSALACLGICIGVLAIASLGIFGNVLALSADDAIGDIGNQIVITPNADEGVEELTARDVAAIERVAGDAGVAPLKTDGAQLSRGSESTFATVYGIDRPGEVYVADEGRLPDRHRQGAILGADVAETLDADAGSVVTVEGTDLRVVAVLEPTEGFTPAAPDGAVLLPESAFPGTGYDQVIVEADSGAEAAVIAEAIRETLNTREDRVDVFELTAVVEDVEEFFGLLSGFLLGLGAISLVVAGVSILNVMLMSAIERRTEIGVLRAVGVRKREVMATLLVEAGLLGVIGGLVGVVLTALLVAGLYLFSPVDLTVVLDPTNALYLLGAFAFGVLISVVSGLYPAWRAASVPPVEALRE